MHQFIRTEKRVIVFVIALFVLSIVAAVIAYQNSFLPFDATLPRASLI